MNPLPDYFCAGIIVFLKINFDFTTIIERIEETVDDVGYGGEVKIYIDTEQYLPEGDVLNWVDDRNEEAFQNGD